MKTRLSLLIGNLALDPAYIARAPSSKGFQLQLKWKELIIQTHSPAFTTPGMSHRIYGPLQLHSCKTNNRSTWLNRPSLKSSISPQIPLRQNKQISNIPRKQIIVGSRKIPPCTSSYQETDICSLVCGKSWHISNRSGRISLEKPGISRISTSYLKAYPASARIQNPISTCFRQPPLSPHMDPSFRPWQTAFKWLTYGRREFAAATCDMGISAYKYKTRLILAIQQIQHSDVVQFYAVFCKIDRIPDLSVVGLLRFLYLSLQICSHECDNRTNEVFLCLNAEDSGEKIWSTFLLRPLHLSVSRLYWIGSGVEPGLVEKSPPLSTLKGTYLPFRHSWNRNVFLCSLFGIVCSPVEDTPSLCICLYISTYLYSNLSCLMLRWQYPPSLLSRATSPPLVPLGIAMSLFSYFPVITSVRSGLWR